MDPYDYLVFTNHQNETLVGDNSTNPRNGIKASVSIPEDIVIPSHYEGVEITQIGQRAFYFCPNV